MGLLRTAAGAPALAPRREPRLANHRGRRPARSGRRNGKPSYVITVMGVARTRFRFGHGGIGHMWPQVAAAGQRENRQTTANLL